MEGGGGARWKGRDAAGIAVGDPMSNIIRQLQSSFQQSQIYGLLTGSAVLLEADSEQTKLLNRACLGRPIITADFASSSSFKGRRAILAREEQIGSLQWFQLGLEEAFYLSYSLNCLKICRSSVEGRQTLSHDESWRYMKEREKTFVLHYKAYSHLRAKNWVVRSGLQYGADFVAYRHHPALVHSEKQKTHYENRPGHVRPSVETQPVPSTQVEMGRRYAVIVSSEADDRKGRLTTWSDWQSMLRLCGSVAKTTLLMTIVPKNNKTEEASPSCLDNYNVEEFEIKRWMAEKHRENVSSRKEKR